MMMEDHATASNSHFGGKSAPLLVEADMDALAAVAHQAGLGGIDLHALAKVLDAAQRIAIAEERERCAKVAEDFLTSGRSPLGRAVADAIRKA